MINLHTDRKLSSFRVRQQSHLMTHLLLTQLLSGLKVMNSLGILSRFHLLTAGQTSVGVLGMVVEAEGKEDSQAVDFVEEVAPW